MNCARAALLIVMLGGVRTISSAQSTTPRTVRFILPAAPTAAALQAHNLRWITTGNDFDQNALVSSAIDVEIARRMNAYDRETAIITFDVPINSKQLTGPVLQRYTAFDPRIGVLNGARNGGPLDREANFWRYRDFAIAVSGDGFRDQLNVYAIARALEILRIRYPKAYTRLFEDTRRYASTDPTNSWKNRFDTYLFSFDNSPLDIAGGLTALGTGLTPAGRTVAEFPDVALISIHPSAIQGASGQGSGPLYRRSTDENYVRYLREGLVETMVHEALHRFIDYRNSYEAIYNKLYGYRVDSVAPAIVRTSVEEAIVSTTSLSYFQAEGGLQPDVPVFYRGVLDSNIELLKSSGVASQFAQLVSPGRSGSDYVDRLRLAVLD